MLPCRLLHSNDELCYNMLQWNALCCSATCYIKCLWLLFVTREGSNQTPAHDYSDFRFKTYAPIAFRYFKELFGIQPHAFLVISRLLLLLLDLIVAGCCHTFLSFPHVGFNGMKTR